MALMPHLDLRLSSSLIMTPQLMQSIKLLQMTGLELEQFIDEELEKNPLLERDETATRDDGNEPVFSQNDETQNLAPLDYIATIPDAETLSDVFDASLDNLYPDEGGQRFDEQEFVSSQGLMSQQSSQSFDSVDINQNLAEKPTLRGHVQEQIIFAFANKHERFIALDLADQLDDVGYFTGDLDDTALRLNSNIEDVQAVYLKLKQFDPPGLFASSLSECLALQLQRRDRFDPGMAKLLDNLNALAKRDFVYLSRICGVDQSDLIEMLEEIRALDPKPGLAFSHVNTDIIVPDVIILEQNDHVFHVELNHENLPRLIMHNDYSLKICANADERNFMSECLQNAQWLLRALDQRAKTLLKVSAEIVRYQEDFLRYGIAHLKPLNLAMLAQAVGMHESTISRVTANKYVATPRGTFEMRKFFSIALQSSQGAEAHAADAVRHRIGQLIEAEDLDNVLSDDALVVQLKSENIDIARRTVAKYRESMNIASSIARKREKKARGHTIKS